MAKRSKKLPDIPIKDDIPNPFMQYHDSPYIDRLIQFGEPTTPGDPYSFDIPPHIDSWLNAIDAADNGDKSVLVALMKSGHPLPDSIVPHIGDLIDRWNLVRPKHRMRVPSHRLTDEDITLNAASCDVDDLLSAGKSLSVALTEVATERDLPESKLREYRAKRLGPDRRTKARGYNAKRRNAIK
jgi:hypothetical protein